MTHELKIGRRYSGSEGTLDVGYGETDLDVVNNSIVRGRVEDEAKIAAIVDAVNAKSAYEALCAQMADALCKTLPELNRVSPSLSAPFVRAALTAYRTLSPDPQWQRVPEMLEALKPFAAMADHYPMKGLRYGNRPQSGTLYAVSSGDLPDAEITVEHLHAAKRARGEG